MPPRQSPCPFPRLVALRATLALLALLATAPAAAAQALPSDSAVRAIIEQRVGEGRSAGIVVGLVDADGSTRVVAFGDPGPGKLPLDANTVFEIGSVSKVFTSTLLARMALEGMVSLDDSAQKFLPADVRLPTRNGKVITLGLLSTQFSGLPRMPTNLTPKNAGNPYADYSVQQMYDFLSGLTLPRDPGEAFEYSNLGVGLLGHLLSLAAGKSYEQLEREFIWQPLGMTRTAITLTPWMTEHLALGHGADGSVVPNWDFPTLAGAGAIRSTVTDMMRFIDANIHTDRDPLGRAMAMAHEERNALPGRNVAIGLNWIIRRAAADTILWHNGGTGGYRSFAGFVPSRRVGVVVLTNSGGEGADDIGMHLLSQALPLAPKPVPVKVRAAIDLPPEALASFVGTYQLAPQFSVEITLSEGKLRLQATGQGMLELWPETATEFFLKEVDAQVTFVRDAQGNVTSLILHQNGRNEPGRKVK